MELLLNVRRDDNGATVEVGGEVDAYSSGQLLEYARGALHDHGPRIAVDLAGVTFMDCGGVDVLLGLRHLAYRLGGQLRIVSASAPVRRVLDVLDMNLLSDRMHAAHDEEVDCETVFR
jgi:anti-anti-sigma factor